MSRTDELMQAERRIRDLVPRWNDAEASSPLADFDEEAVMSELAYAQMQFERHLAETDCRERENEQSRLEAAMPAFTSLRLWYSLRTAGTSRGASTLS